MRRLFPSSSAPAPAPEWSLEEIAEEYAYPPLEERAAGASGASGAWLRGNMVASLDGAIHHGGRSQPLSSKADMGIFGVLRALADVVVVGAQTVRQEGYRPAKPRAAFAERRAAAGQPPAPAIAVVSAGLELDFSLPLFTEPVVPTLLVTGVSAPPARLALAREAGAEVVFAGEGAAVDPARVPEALAARGLGRQLTEGGPTLLGGFAAAGVLDELCLSLAPRITVGDAPRITKGPVLPVPDEFTLDGVLEEDGFLFTRYRRYRQSAE
ncbi:MULTISPECIES: pyrimidine reductase family protein [unclassified Streptomyces]|uniref:pyrimidine reductase family protein n=1 Tax=unclassified Streptomyces TaxID=2593676 RepID=UPI002DD8FFC2|nr:MULTISPECIES: pyrimidine reductase family protein [unclassified Streptomyces]WSA91788.1 pyrimidine reductase family protein [Streptomyces sp. NBC_01795]WSB76158.1 pyrimidine reductase family protein [Streptomyces sp. NBC_01775]WSS15568.1 pyrimidine reductase family protein [Streptomyces sp. NBC_01186]WSS44409.1 pyrimidine reductase family protein [Streptomyces sp. NBC_01187]